MKQFKSVAKRREHQKGHGIRARYPEPGGFDYQVGDAQFVRKPPSGDPMWQAAMIDRWLRFADQYAAIDARYGGPLRWRVAPYPVEYAPGPVDDVFARLVNKYLDGLTSPPGGLGGAGTGPGGYSPTPPFELSLYTTVVPEFGVEDLRTQTWATGDNGFGWVSLTNGTITGCVWRKPDQTETTYYPTHPPIVTDVPIVQTEVNAGGAGYLDHVEIWQKAVELILWGHTSGIAKLDDTSVGNALQRPAGFAAQEWMAWIEVNAGRILWQMAHVECLLMLTDLCNVATGGRGGPTGHAGNTLTGPPTPNTNPPVNHSTWSKVAPYVDKALSGAVQAATEALIMSL